MEEKAKITEEEKSVKVDKIEWMGVDGLLVLAYFALVVVMFCSLKYRIDFLTGWVFPMALLLIVLFVTFNYAKTLRGFIKAQNEKIGRGKKV